MSDKEEPSAPLWYSEVLSVKHPPSHAIPPVDQGLDEGSKVPSSPRSENVGDVFIDDPPRLQPSSKRSKFEREVPALIAESLSLSADGERLAGWAPDKKVNWSLGISTPKLREVPVQGDVRKVVREDGSGERIDLGEANASPPEVTPRDRRSLDA